MVTHGNLMCNSAQIAEACGHDAQKTICGWVPLYHDMGLVGLIQAAFTGARCLFMPPGTIPHAAMVVAADDFGQQSLV